MTHLLLILAIAVMIAIVMLLVSYTSKRSNGYDERQIAARGRVFKVSFFVLLIYNLFGGALDYMFDWGWAPNAYIFGGVGAVIAMLVFVVMSIWNHAYFRTKDVAWKQVLVFGLCGVVYLAVFLTHSDELQFVENGQVQHTALLFGIAGIDLVACVTFLLRRFLDMREEAGEPEEMADQ